VLSPSIFIINAALQLTQDAILLTIDFVIIRLTDLVTHLVQMNTLKAFEKRLLQSLD